MDPKTALQNALEGSKDAALAYNIWVQGGGFKICVKAWMPGVKVPQIIEVVKVGPKFIRGNIGYANRYTTALISSVLTETVGC